MVSYPRKTKLIQQGSPVSGIFFIYSGKVKVYMEGRNGSEQIIRFAKDGHILGHRGYTGGKLYNISVSTLEDSVFCFFEKDFFLKLIAENHKLTYDLLFFYAEELRHTDDRLRKMAELSLKERVADAILMILNCFGTEGDTKTLAYTISRIDLAKLTGSVPDVISRQLADLAKSGIINLKGKKIEVPDLEKLKEAASYPEFQVK